MSETPEIPPVSPILPATGPVALAELTTTLQSLLPGTLLEARIQSLIRSGVAVLELLGKRIEVALPEGVPASGTLVLRVRSAGPRSVLEFVRAFGETGEPDSQEAAPGGAGTRPATVERYLQQLARPSTAETRAWAAALLRQGAPARPEAWASVETAARLPDTGPAPAAPLRIEMAASLAASGLEADPRLLETVARTLARAALQAGSPGGGNAGGVPGDPPFLPVGERVSPEALRVALQTAATAGPEEPPAAAALRLALEEDPLLRTLDRLIQDARLRLAGAGEAPRTGVLLGGELLKALQDLTSAMEAEGTDRGAVTALAQRLAALFPGAPRSALEEVLDRLAELEVRAMRQSGTLASLSRPDAALEALANLRAGLRALDAASSRPGERVTHLLIPVLWDHAPRWIQLRVATRETDDSGGGKAGARRVLTGFALRVETDALGLVAARLSVRPGEEGRLRFRVKSEKARRLFHEHQNEIGRVLASLGVPVTVDVETGDPEPDEAWWLPDRGGAPPRSVDVRI